MTVQYIPVGRIVPDADQPRKHYDEEALCGLSESLRQHGMLQPISVTPNGDLYRIITGERRWRAAQLAAMADVPCIVKTLDEDTALTEQLVENIQREDLQPIEKAIAIDAIKRRVSATNREVSERLGMSERQVGYLLDLLELPFDISDQVVSSPNRPADGQVTEKHARFLKQLNEQPDLQAKVVDRIRGDRMNSDQTGKLVKALRQNPDNSEEIMNAPVTDLSGFLKASERLSREPELQPEEPARAPVGAVAHISQFVESLEHVRPMDMQRPQVRELQDVLTTLRMTIDALLRECKLELGEA